MCSGEGPGRRPGSGGTGTDVKVEKVCRGRSVGLEVDGTNRGVGGEDPAAEKVRLPASERVVCGMAGGMQQVASTLRG